MHITSAEFVKGITGTDSILYDGKLQIAFVGRSNVGKSSLINALVNRKRMARSSSSPGKTVRLDFFLINNSFYFVDLPGYGFARVSKQRHEDIRKMMLWYLEYSGVSRRCVVLIVDVRVGMTAFDRQMTDILCRQAIRYCIAANKIDALPSGREREKALDAIRKDAGGTAVIPVSGHTAEGVNELMNAVHVMNAR